MHGFGLVLALVSAQVISEEPINPSQAEPAVWRSSRQVFVLSVGATSWPTLHAMGPVAAEPGWAPFASTGFAIRFDWRVNAFYLGGGAELLLGASAGLDVTRGGAPQGVPVNQAGQPDPKLQLAGTGLALTLDARLQRAAGPWRPFLSGGAGAYGLALDIEEPGIASVTDRELFNRWKPMAWLGAGLDYRFGPPERCWGLSLEFHVQMVDMGSAESVAPWTGTLRGPIYSLTLGALLGLGQ